ncbi:MAG: DinB family protein [Ilumatobacteraceae bacterium]
MTIVPDNKNWTWVLERPCPDCAFDSQQVVPSQIGAQLRDIATQWEAILVHPDVTRRPKPNVWSPLEYACHVRDVFTIFDSRLGLMLTELSPTFVNWDQDATAIADRYDTQDPLVVRGQLTKAANQLAEHFETVSGAQWSRVGTRSDGATFTVESFGRYLLHDPIHHLWDVSHTFEV